LIFKKPNAPDASSNESSDVSQNESQYASQDASQDVSKDVSQDVSQDVSKAQSSDENQRKLVEDTLKYFDSIYPEPKCGLTFQDPYELLVATILSAQCTDARVNQITPHLFKAFPNVESLAGASIEAILDLIKSCGLYRAKAKNLKLTAQKIVTEFKGKVPGKLEDLITLPGVGRKTANVVLGDAFGIPALTVDTHLGRLSRRLGFSRRDDANAVEADLMKIIPQPLWTRFSHQAINHGRQICRARKPACIDCKLNLCPSRVI
jgi:endonuclease-3